MREEEFVQIKREEREQEGETWMRSGECTEGGSKHMMGDVIKYVLYDGKNSFSFHGFKPNSM